MFSFSFLFFFPLTYKVLRLRKLQDSGGPSFMFSTQ